MGSQRLDNINKEEVQALQNLKVLDLTRVVAGPYGASILGDFGADVLKIGMTPGVMALMSMGRAFIMQTLTGTREGSP